MGRIFRKGDRRREGECTLVFEDPGDMVVSLETVMSTMARSDVLERTRSMAAVLQVASELQALLPWSYRRDRGISRGR
jgi:hypothetical protein